MHTAVTQVYQVLFSHEVKLKVVLKFDWTVVEHVSDTYLTMLDLIV